MNVHVHKNRATSRHSQKSHFQRRDVLENEIFNIATFPRVAQNHFSNVATLVFNVATLQRSVFFHFSSTSRRYRDDEFLFLIHKFSS